MNEPNKIVNSKDIKNRIDSFTRMMMSISIIDGLTQIILIPNMYYLKETLNNPPSIAAHLMFLYMLPYSLKFVYGYLSDNYFLFGYRMKGYFIIFGMIECLVMFSLATKTSQTNFSFCMMIFIHNMSVSFREALGEGLIAIISKLKEEYIQCIEEETPDMINQELAHYQNDPLANYKKSRDNISIFFIMKALGITLGSFIGGNFLHLTRLENVYFVAAFLPIIIMFQAIFLFDEPRQIFSLDNRRRVFVEDVAAVKSVLTHPDVYYPLVVLLLFCMLPNIHHGIQWIVIDVLKFTPVKIGFSHVLSGVLYIILMVIVYSNIKKYSLLFIFSLAMFSNFLSLPMNLTITNENLRVEGNLQILVYTSSVFFRKFSTELMMIPTFSRICAICPVHHES